MKAGGLCLPAWIGLLSAALVMLLAVASLAHALAPAAGRKPMPAPPP